MVTRTYRYPLGLQILKLIAVSMQDAPSKLIDCRSNICTGKVMTTMNCDVVDHVPFS